MHQYLTAKNINATVRTPRCAILINEASTDWKAAAGGVIMRSSEIWGGRHFLLIPTDGERIKDKFWELLEAYSPDHIAVYNLTFADKEVAEPTEYASTRSRLRDDWNAKNYGSDFDEWFEKQAEVTFHDKLTISITLERQLIDRLSPFHFHCWFIPKPARRVQDTAANSKSTDSRRTRYRITTRRLISFSTYSEERV